MVNFGNAITKPFTDTKSLGIGIILGAIPFVNALTVNGFGMNCAKHADKKSLPNWENIVDHIIKSILAIIVSIIYMIPAIIVGIIVIGTLIASIMPLISGGTVDLNTIINSMIGTGIVGFAICAILALIAVFLLPLALTRYVIKGGFGDAFALGKIIKRALTGEYIIAWIVYLIYAFIVSAVLSFIGGMLLIVPVIGFVIAMLFSGLAMYMMSVTGFTIFGQLKWKD